MSNTYSMTAAPHLIRDVIGDAFAGEGVSLDIGNLAPLPGIYPDHAAPILRLGAGGLRLTLARWGMPSPQSVLAGKRTDPGVTNLRNTASPHWQRWLGPAQRCLVPVTSFAEIDSRPGAPRGHMVWMALGPDRPLAFLAGVWTEWSSVRRLKEGMVTADLFGFLTCAPNGDVAPVHPKAMPVILTQPTEWRQWLTAPAALALQLQRPLPDGMLQIVAEGTRADAA